MPEQPSSSALPEDAQRELRAAFEESSLEFEDLQFQQHGLGYDIFGHVSWEVNSTDHNKRTYRLHRTFVFFYRPRTTLPEAMLYSKSTIVSNLLGPFTRLLGMPRCQLAGEDQFNSRYDISSATPDSLCALLTRQAIDALVTVQEAVITIKPRGVLFMRHQEAVTRSSTPIGPFGSRQVHNADQRITGNDLQPFFNDATTACAAFANDPDAGRRAADAVEGTFAEEAVRNVTGRGGFIGKVIKKHLVTRPMLETLRNQPIPRSDIPEPVRKLGWKGSTTFVMGVLLLLGTIALIIALSIRNGESSWWVLLLLSLGAYGGILPTYCYRAARKRLVIHGHAVPGFITGVEQTGDKIGDAPIYRIVVQPHPSGSCPIVSRMPDQAAKAARRFMEQGRETWVLIDPRKPGRGTWPEGWSLEALPD